ncbi:MAG TPA: hypothetical protein VHN74_05365 [Candidatus Angelobacter sp.]|jgi:hypothetical protein|nr:hypothetical protein [Candidatus Angelobacter sp.]
MKRLRVYSAALLLVLLAAASSIALAQLRIASPANDSYLYDPAQQVTVEGKVLEVREFKCPVSGTLGSHITLKASDSPIQVHLAPVAFMKEFEIVLHEGDTVKVVGAKILDEGKPALLARSVTVGNETFTFRDPKGKALW